MDVITSVADFRKQIPFFYDSIIYPDELVETTIKQATFFVTKIDFGRLNGEARVYAIYLMTAHLLRINTINQENNGGALTYETSASIDNVSVSVAPPIGRDLRERWYEYSSWGIQLRALLAAKSCIPFPIGRR